MNPIKKLHDFGQAPWMDYIHRKFLAEGGLEKAVREDGLSGVTSNPSIFEKAIGGGTAYDEQLRQLVEANPRAPVGELYQALAVADIRRAADVLRPVWDKTGGADGFVSLEVSPYLAHDTEGTCEEARRLWRAVGRPNLMIKVPATPAGIPAITTLLAEGINVNVTLMFSLDDYEAVAGAYLAALERIDDRERLSTIASVASFFVSRVDGKVDPLLEAIGSPEALALRGKIAIDNAKLAYKRFEEVFHGERFEPFRERGAKVQRVLYGSTSTKNPEYSDVLYVEELIGPETVNTVPPKTLDAFRDHGEPRQSLTEGVEEAEERLRALAGLGIDLDQITEDLQREGVASFADSFDELLAAVEEKRRSLLAASAKGGQKLFAGADLGTVAARLQGWQDEHLAARLWSREAGVWGDAGGPEGEEIFDRLGWLTLPHAMLLELPAIEAFAEEVRGRGIERVIVLGMGGSSLAPEVFARTFGRRPAWPELTVLDSTHPRAVAGLAERLAADPGLAKCFFVVSSKSGTTLETQSYFRLFWQRLSGAVDKPGEHFAAVTDPGTPLADLARERAFAGLFLAPPDVGGRFSALTPFGLVPAALAGVEVRGLLDRALALAEGAHGPALVNEPLRLGAALGELARAGRDKVTFLATPGLAAFPDWLEQLLAESTGKAGRGLVPVAHEVPGEPSAYGDDRFFAGLTLADDPQGEREGLERRLTALERAGHPVVRLTLRDPLDLGREMFRWELAVAAAGAVLGIHPFNQPDVQLAKDMAKKAMEEGASGAGSGDGAVGTGDREALAKAVGDWLAAAGPGGYVAVQAYLAPTGETACAVTGLQRALRDRTGCAATQGFGPRFLHSTGQLHKGGPEGGLFLQLLDAPGEDVEIPESDGATFGRLIRAQAVGDRRALESRGRRVLTVDLGADPQAGLAALTEVVTAAAPAAVTAAGG